VLTFGQRCAASFARWLWRVSVFALLSYIFWAIGLEMLARLAR